LGFIKLLFGKPVWLDNMTGFIFCCLALGYLVQTKSEYLLLVSAPISLYTGICFIVASAIASQSNRIHFTFIYDGFAIGALLIWFTYWQQIFNAEAPMFYLFPLYFALVTAGVTLLFLRRDELLDEDTLKAMPTFSGVLNLHPAIIAAVVLISIAIPDQFLLFPTTMTLFIMRFTFSSYLAKHLPE
jgi:hypothetical protein